MRRSLVAPIVVVAVALGGCGGSADENGTAASPTGSATTTASSVAADNTQQVCTQAKALRDEYKQKAADVLTRGLTAGVSDPDKADQILGEMVPLAKDYKARFETLAATATNQELKSALIKLAGKLNEVTSENAAGAVAVTEGMIPRLCGV